MANVLSDTLLIQTSNISDESNHINSDPNKKKKILKHYHTICIFFSVIMLYQHFTITILQYNSLYTNCAGGCEIILKRIDKDFKSIFFPRVTT